MFDKCMYVGIYCQFELLRGASLPTLHIRKVTFCPFLAVEKKKLKLTQRWRASWRAIDKPCDRFSFAVRY